MSKRFELVVFDWDGTLMDSAGSIVAAIQAAAADLGLPVPPVERARHVIGLGLQEALQYAVPELEPAGYGSMVERYRHHYLSGDHELQLFEGVVELLQWLRAREVNLAVATGKSRLGLQRALAHSGLEPYFHATRCADECFSKPHPAMLEELMDELMVGAEATLMIGDTTHDMLMARNAGVSGLAVTFGAHEREVLVSAGPLACVDTPEELAAWLKTNL